MHKLNFILLSQHAVFLYRTQEKVCTGPSEALEGWSGEARKKICDLFFGGKEAALAASRYIEGHALTLRKENSI